MKTIRIMILVIALLLSACGAPAVSINVVENEAQTTENSANTVSASSESKQVAEEKDTSAKAESEEPRDIVILYTGDVHAAVDQGIGYDGFAAIKEGLQKSCDVLAVDTGDAIQGELIGTLTDGEAVIELMNKLGYDVCIPGNHEFDYGMDEFLSLTEKADFSYVSANFNKEGKLIFEPYVIKEAGDKKIAFIGVTTPDTVTSSTPKYFQNDSGEYIYDFMKDNDGKELFAAVQAAVDSSRKDGADYVVILAHLGNEATDAPFNYESLINNVKGIDALLDGHSHDSDQVSMIDSEGRTVLRSASGTKLSSIGYLRISAKDGSLSSGLYNWNNNISPSELFGFENEMSVAIDEAMDELDDTINTVVAKTSVDLIINHPTEEDANGKPIRIVRVAETNLADLCVDAVRTAGDTDIAILNGGGIRAEIPKGDITIGDIVSVHPFGNTVCVIETTGQAILNALEWGARAVPNELGAFLHTSGLSYEIHSYIESSVQEDENGFFNGVNGEYRVKNVLVGDKPLDPTAMYTVASISYILLENGDGFSMFKDSKVLIEELALDNQVLIDYITKELGGVVGEEYADPYGNGRIIVIDSKS